MRKTVLAASVAAALTPVFVATPSFADDEDDAYTTETVVYSQRRLVMASELVRPEISLFMQNLPNDTAFGIGVGVDWTPIEKLQVGALASPRVSPDTAVNNPSLYVRYLLLDKAPVQLAVQAGYTFTDPSPGSVQLGVPLRIPLTPAARLDVTPIIDINLPNDGNGDESSVDLNLGLSLGVSFTRALYLDLQTGFIMPDFDADFANIPLGFELGYGIKGGEESAFIDVFLRFRFDAFILPSAPEGTDAVNMENWLFALGARVHFGYDSE